jgi:hypothetical protein
LNTTSRHSATALLPAYGSLLFIILYITAALLYPGGSQADKQAKGFSWLNNYWCNLLNEKAINGTVNPARPFALTGMLVLCTTLSLFWFNFPRFAHFKNPAKIIYQLSGLLSMFSAMMLFSRFHDLATNVAGAFGVIALVGTFAGLRRFQWNKLFVFGIFNLLLVVLNNYLYYHSDLIYLLPVVQKISFASFLCWICCISVMLFRTNVS